MTREELIEWAHGWKRCAAVVHECRPALLDGITWQVLLWHWVDNIGFVHAGFGRDFSCFDEAWKFARECTDEVEIETVEQFAARRAEALA